MCWYINKNRTVQYRIFVQRKFRTFQYTVENLCDVYSSLCHEQCVEATTQLKSVMLVDEAYCRSISGSDFRVGRCQIRSDSKRQVGSTAALSTIVFWEAREIPRRQLFSSTGVARFLCVAFASLRSIISFTAPSRPTKSSRIPVGILSLPAALHESSFASPMCKRCQSFTASALLSFGLLVLSSDLIYAPRDDISNTPSEIYL